ncbi:hypothetical protein F0562_025311 [Nyssa sinensis]|uniref:Uncharacterized protein n=1 Tax=Nyssa sinensis TaxID=561372 RepID=A0A5J5BGI2_9ASTE|nr:hypothetical protein F0562_025311 [Nyssa sinensis]
MKTGLRRCDWAAPLRLGCAAATGLPRYDWAAPLRLATDLRVLEDWNNVVDRKIRSCSQNERCRDAEWLLIEASRCRIAENGWVSPFRRTAACGLPLASSGKWKQNEGFDLFGFL